MQLTGLIKRTLTGCDQFNLYFLSPLLFLSLHPIILLSFTNRDADKVVVQLMNSLFLFYFSCLFLPVSLRFVTTGQVTLSTSLTSYTTVMFHSAEPITYTHTHAHILPLCLLPKSLSLNKVYNSQREAQRERGEKDKKQR